MRRSLSAKATLTSVLAVGVLLGGCVETRLRDQADFGNAARQDRAAQIADPDAHYAGVPAPGANGMHADASVERYVRGQVIPPVQTQTSSALSSNNNSNTSAAAAPAPSSGQ
jgi:hypothetical protein